MNNQLTCDFLHEGHRFWFFELRLLFLHYLVRLLDHWLGDLNWLHLDLSNLWNLSFGFSLTEHCFWYHILVRLLFITLLIIRIRLFYIGFQSIFQLLLTHALNVFTFPEF